MMHPHRPPLQMPGRASDLPAARVPLDLNTGSFTFTVALCLWSLLMKPLQVNIYDL